MTDSAGQPGQRIDRWLWYARFLKSRSLAGSFVQTGKIRVNGERISRASRLVRPGDVLTFPLGPHIRVIKVTVLGLRRGPAPEARLLYEDLDPPPERTPQTQEENASGGRPSKKERREITALKRGR